VVRPPRTYSEEQWRKQVDRFQDEAATIASLHHPNVVHVYDYFATQGTAYMVMELLHGQNLRELAQQQDRLSEDTVLNVAHQIGTALNLVHERGKIHRDVTPNNIMLTEDDRLVLIDFGGARVYLDKTMLQTAIWTPGFAAPEAMNEAARRGPYTDVYGLAATCYCLLTGKEYDQDKNNPEHESMVGPQWWPALHHALLLDRSERTPDIPTFLHELDRGSAQQPTSQPVVAVDQTSISAVEGGQNRDVVGEVVRLNIQDVLHIEVRPAKLAWRSLCLVSPTTGWVAGDDGTILKLKLQIGGKYELIGEGHPTDDEGRDVKVRLNSISMYGLNDGWAVGDGGMILKYRRGRWTHYFQDFSKADLTGLHLTHAGEGVAVGSGGTFLFCRNGAWSPTSTSGSGFERLAELQMNGVALFDSTNGWAVGDGGWMVHIRHNQYEAPALVLPNRDFKAISMTEAGDGCIVGSGGVIMRCRGRGSWIPEPPNEFTDDLHCVQAVSSTEAWAGGEYGTILYYGLGLGNTGGNTPAWQRLPTPISEEESKETITSIQMSAGTEQEPPTGWAVGDQSAILYYDGSIWRRAELVTK